MKVFGILYTQIFTEFHGMHWSFCNFLLFFILEFSFEVIRNSVHTNLYEIPRNSNQFRDIVQENISQNYAELREIKLISYKILNSAEFQKGTSKNTLLERGQMKL